MTFYLIALHYSSLNPGVSAPPDPQILVTKLHCFFILITLSYTIECSVYCTLLDIGKSCSIRNIHCLIPPKQRPSSERSSEIDLGWISVGRVCSLHPTVHL